MGRTGSVSGAASIPLLGPGDPPPVAVLNAGAPSPFLLLGDHAGRAIPRALGDLGLTLAQLDLHIACDIGVAGLGEQLAVLLDACFIQQRYSRLMIDCNRKPGSAAAILAVSDGVAVPGNRDLSAEAAQARHDQIYQPYQDEIARTLDARADRPTVLVALHSFTPAMQGQARPWRLGVLHRGDSPFSRAMLAVMRADLGEAVGDNQPYEMDETDNTIPLHADARGLDYLELEVRQDLLATAADQRTMAQWLAPRLAAALASEEIRRDGR
nr:N-formylglutamate amidohydrolase [Phenylobacterium aquaticum]